MGATLNDDDRGPVILVACWVGFTITTVVISAKVFRRAKSGTWGHDDSTIVFTMGIAIVVVGLFTAGVHYGLGKHLDLLTPQQADLASKYSWIGQCFAIMSFAIGKVSIAFFDLRMLERARKRWHVYVLEFFVISVVLANAVTVILILAQCQPLAKLFNPFLKGTCWNRNVVVYFGYFTGGYDALTDIALAVFPIYVISNLQIPRSNKISCSFMVGLGPIAAVCAIMKTIQVKENQNTIDFSYTTAQLIIWNIVEMFVIITAACAAALRPLIECCLTTANGKKSSRSGSHIRITDSTPHPLESMRKSRGYHPDSEENMVRPVGQEIYKTTCISVMHEDPSTREESVKSAEMGHEIPSGSNV
ncbi:hypothetical protein MMC12_002864 [Toensbergia leucococca]|nr:hypothetical protein [Toensbergia leucococca]